jgi:hypothetical protein
MEGINLVSVWHKNSFDKISIVPSTIILGNLFFRNLGNLFFFKNLGNLFNYHSPAIYTHMIIGVHMKNIEKKYASRIVWGRMH